MYTGKSYSLNFNTKTMYEHFKVNADRVNKIFFQISEIIPSCLCNFKQTQASSGWK